MLEPTAVRLPLMLPKRNQDQDRPNWTYSGEQVLNTEPWSTSNSTQANSILLMATKMNFLSMLKTLSLVELRILKLAPEQNIKDCNRRTCKPSGKVVPQPSQAKPAPVTALNYQIPSVEAE